MTEDEQAGKQTDAEKPGLQARKIYVKDASFESPNAPAIFTADWNPALAVDVDHEINKLTDDTYDLVLTITARAAVDDRTAFLVEVHQGGIFSITGHTEEQLQRRLNVYCLRVLYPYACATVDSLVVQGGFPPLYLGPINFDARYQQMLEQSDTQNHSEEAV
jgi:preprotein translocase subunit SecB